MLEIYQGGHRSAVEDLAMEAWMLDRAAEGMPSVFATSWTGPVVVLGYAQKPDDVDLEFCEGRHIPVLRRLTGGTGVVHRMDLGLSLALPADDPWARGVIGLYGRFLGVLEPALRRFQPDIQRKQDPPRASVVRSPICFFDQLSDTLLVGGRKAVGCAQTRRRGAVLIHAAILLGTDADLIARVFRAAVEEVDAGLTAAVPGGDWRSIGRTIAGDLAEALGRPARDLPEPALARRHIEPYANERWAPLSSDLVEQILAKK